MGYLPLEVAVVATNLCSRVLKTRDPDPKKSEMRRWVRTHGICRAMYVSNDEIAQAHHACARYRVKGACRAAPVTRFERSERA